MEKPLVMINFCTEINRGDKSFLILKKIYGKQSNYLKTGREGWFNLQSTKKTLTTNKKLFVKDEATRVNS